MRVQYFIIFIRSGCAVWKSIAGNTRRTVNRAGIFAQMEKLIPHMKRLGITALYIGPCFESEGHGYETIDYYKVDARLGDNAMFRHFVDACHAAQIKVVVDGVFNHSGRRFFAFEELRKHREGSPYRDWYCNVNFGGNNEFNDCLDRKSTRLNSSH